MHILPPKPFYFIRHGETEWNRIGRYMGQRDIPLNSFGQTQARDMQARVQSLDVETMCVSPLTRTLETAKILNDGWGKPLQVVEDLKEVGWGIHEGEWQDDGSRFNEWISGNFVPQGGESLKQFVARVQKGVSQALESTGPVLIVSHGGVFYGLQTLLKLPLDFALSNCELMSVEYKFGVWTAVPV